MWLRRLSEHVEQIGAADFCNAISNSHSASKLNHENRFQMRIYPYKSLALHVFSVDFGLNIFVTVEGRE